MPSTLEAKSPVIDFHDPATMERLQQQYVEAVMPHVRSHAQIHFGRIPDPGRRDDAIQNAIGIGWKHFLSAVRHGKDPSEFPTSIADKAVRQVRAGRVVWRQEPAKDVLSPRAQRNKGFAVEQLEGSTRRSHDELFSDPHGQERIDALEETLTDNRVTPPPEQVAFKELYQKFLDDLGPKKRPIVEDMATGEDTKDLAERHKVSAGRISQIRREAEQAWRKIDRDDEDLSR